MHCLIVIVFAILFLLLGLLLVEGAQYSNLVVLVLIEVESI